MSTQEKRRLERLKKELDSQQKKLDTEKRKYQRQLKELKAEQSQLKAQKRDLNTKMKKFNLSKKEAANASTKSNKRSSTVNTAIERKLREEIKEMKSKSESTKKQLREARKELDAANDEIKILRRKLKHSHGPSQTNISERKIKQARREIYNMKRRLKIAMSDLDKQAKYYESQLRRFKLDEQKWINRQREISKEKNIIIKYVFIDDIQKLKIYKNNNDKIRISTFEGGEVVIKDINITTTTEMDTIADEVIDKLVQEIQVEFGKRRKKRYDNYKDTKLKTNVSNISNVSNTSNSIEREKRRKNKKGKDTITELKDEKENNESMEEDSITITPMSNMGDMKDFDDIYRDIEEEDYIDQCYHILMKEISERTRDLYKINTCEDIEILLENIKNRHDEIKQKLNEMQYEYVDEMPEMFENWQEEIYKLIHEYPKQKTGNNNKMFKHKTEMLNKVIAVLNEEQPKSLLDEMIENESDEPWKNILNELSKIKANVNLNKNEVEIDENQMVLCNELINEMILRENDLESLRKFNENDMEPQEEIDNILENVKKRHAIEMEKIIQIVPENKTESDENNENNLVDNVKNNNVKWEEDLLQFINSNRELLTNKKQNQYNSDELNGRIADLLKLIDIYNQTKSTKMDIKTLKNNFSSFVSSICDRHEYNHKNGLLDNESIECDKDWKDNMFQLAIDMTGLKLRDVMNGNNEMNDSEFNENENEIDGNNMNNNNGINKEFDINEWWLNKDENRNDTVDDINVNDEQLGELYESAMYLTRLLYIDEEDEENDIKFNNEIDSPNGNDVITSLYFPIPLIIDGDGQPNKHNIVSVLYDGVILCKYINKINKNKSNNYIDSRGINLPNAFNPFPINDEYVCDNIQLIISCAQSLGLQLESYEIDDWMNSNNWCQYVIDLINLLSIKYINDRICLRKHRELVRLVKNNENEKGNENMSYEIRKLNGTQWLQRWINYLNNKPVLNEILSENYNNELFTAMKCATETLEEFDTNCELASEILINKYKQITNVKAIDLCNNNSKLQQLFACDLFEHSSQLDKLSDSEKNEYKILFKSSSKSRTENERYCAWINTALSPNVTIINLLNDLSSGYILLKIIDKSKSNCVTWRNVRKKIRHKFDKVNNCNMVMKLCENELGFSLVGMAGSDIVDMNGKFVISLLSQLMRYYQTRQLSMILFKNATNKKQKTVTDNDILQWVNLKINECDDAQSKPISSFKDRTLSTCVFYIELLKAVKPNHYAIDLANVNYNVKPSVNNKVIDKQKHERLQNAIYCITLIRKFGGELFVMPNHLCTMDHKAILAVFAAIMTISIADRK